MKPAKANVKEKSISSPSASSSIVVKQEYKVNYRRELFTTLSMTHIYTHTQANRRKGIQLLWTEESSTTYANIRKKCVGNQTEKELGLIHKKKRYLL